MPLAPHGSRSRFLWHPLPHGAMVGAVVFSLSCLDPFALMAPIWDSAVCDALRTSQPAVGDGGSRSLVVSGAGQFPVMLRYGDTLLVAFRGRGDHLDVAGRIDLMRSADGGESWDERVVVVDSPLDDRNGALGVTKTGHIVVGYVVYDAYDLQGRPLDEPRAMNVYVVSSADGGRTWTQPRFVSARPHRWMSPYGRIVTAPDGRLIMSAYVDQGPGPWSAAYVESLDEGATWSSPRLIDRYHDETSLLVLNGTTWLAAMRSEGNTGITIVQSNDGGRTWGVRMRLTAHNEIPGDLIALNDSTLWLTYGHRRPPYGVRGKLSMDRGRTWSLPVTLVSDGLDTDVGYPSSVLLSSGDVLTAYYQERSTSSLSSGRHAAVVRYDPMHLACAER